MGDGNGSYIGVASNGARLMSESEMNLTYQRTLFQASSLFTTNTENKRSFSSKKKKKLGTSFSELFQWSSV